MTRVITADIKARAFEMSDAGDSPPTIAAELGLSQATVYRWLRVRRAQRGEDEA